MLQIDFDPFPILTTERLVLRPLKITDAEEIFIHRNDEVVNTFLENFRHQSIGDSIAFIERVQREITEGMTIMWVITHNGDDRFMGTVCFWRISKEAHSAETGYTLLSEFHGKGYMNEALARIIHYGLDVMGLRYIDAYTHQHNIASIKLLTRNGFKPGKPQKAVSANRVYYYRRVVR